MSNKSQFHPCEKIVESTMLVFNSRKGEFTIPRNGDILVDISMPEIDTTVILMIGGEIIEKRKITYKTGNIIKIPLYGEIPLISLQFHVIRLLFEGDEPPFILVNYRHLDNIFRIQLRDLHLDQKVTLGDEQRKNILQINGGMAALRWWRD